MRPLRKHEKVEGGYKVTVTPPPIMGFSASSLILSEDQFHRYEQWLSGAGVIQNLLPDLTMEQREILLSGISADAWDEAFGDDDEDTH